VVRGGCWFDTAYICRSSYRFWREAEYRSDFVGLRPARSVQ
jgi:formylglycine-generating enzyme required for sulfatase activity